MQRSSLDSVPPKQRHCVALDGTCGGRSLAVEGDGQVRCLTHAQDVVRIRRREERNLAGGENRRRTLKGERIPWLSFESRERVKRFARELAHQVLTGQLDPRLSAEARGCATLALQCDELELLERLDGLEMKVFGRRLAS